MWLNTDASCYVGRKIIAWKSPVLNFSISIFSSVNRSVDAVRSYDQSKYTNISNNNIRENEKFSSESNHMSLMTTSHYNSSR